MNQVALKNDLIERIEHANNKQLEEIYGLVINYFNKDDIQNGWDTLPAYLQNQITISIEQANAGLGISADEAIKIAGEKYGLNG